MVKGGAKKKRGANPQSPRCRSKKSSGKKGLPNSSDGNGTDPRFGERYAKQPEGSKRPPFEGPKMKIKRLSYFPQGWESTEPVRAL